MEWIIQCAAYRAVIYEDLHPLWEYCKRVDKRPIVLIPLINALPRLYLGEYSLEVCKIVREKFFIFENFRFLGCLFRNCNR